MVGLGGGEVEVKRSCVSHKTMRHVAPLLKAAQTLPQIMSEAERIKVLERYLKEKDRRIALSEVLFYVFFAYVSNALGWEAMTYLFGFVAIGTIIYLVTNRSARIFDDTRKELEGEEEKRSTPIMTQEEYDAEYRDSICPPETRIRRCDE